MTIERVCQVMECCSILALRIHTAHKWLREELGVDLVISPRFNSQNR